MRLASATQLEGLNQDTQKMPSMAARLPRPAADGLYLNLPIPCPYLITRTKFLEDYSYLIFSFALFSNFFFAFSKDSATSGGI